MKTLVLVLALAFTLPMAHARRPIVRVPDAVYLYDLGRPPLELAVARAGVNGFSDPRMTRPVGTLRFPQRVSASAFLPTACLVSAQARQGRVSAWVPYRDLEPLPKNFLKNLQAAERRRKSMEALIARNEIAVGMTEAEVTRSLGRPQGTSHRTTGTTQHTVWEFVRTRSVPQTVMAPHTTHTTHWHPNRRPITTGQTHFQPTTQWVRMPTETTRVTFKDGIVTAISRTEGDPRTGRP